MSRHGREPCLKNLRSMTLFVCRLTGEVCCVHMCAHAFGRYAQDACILHTHTCAAQRCSARTTKWFAKMPGVDNARADEHTIMVDLGGIAGLEAWQAEARNLLLASDRMLAIARRNRNVTQLWHPAVAAHHNALMAQYIGRILAETYYDSDIIQVIPDSIPPLPAPTTTSMSLPYPPPDTELGITASTSMDVLPALPIRLPLDDTQLAPPFAHPNVEAIVWGSFSSSTELDNDDDNVDDEVDAL